LLFPKSPPYFDHRFSNGPTYAERVPGLIGVAPNPGQNFAVGGAETNTDNLANGFLSFYSVTLPGIKSEIDTFISSGGRFQASAVVIHYGGANDYFAFLDQSSTPPPIGTVPAEVAAVTGNIQSNIRSLVAAGARTIVVPNVPDLGDTPAYRGTAFADAATAVSVQHAAALNAQLGALAKELNVNIVVVDFATGLKTVLADPARFGFTNVTSACVPQKSALPPYIDPGTPCPNPNQYLFWDYVHPTSAAHQLLAEYVADTLLAPLTIAAQATFALTNGDSFLRRMQESVLGAGNGSPMLNPGRPADGNLFLNVRRQFGEGSPGKDLVGFDYGVTQVSGGAIFRPWNNVALGLIGGYDYGRADLDQSRGSIGLSSYRLGAMGGYDNGLLFGGAGVALAYDSYGLNRQTFVPQLQSSADTSGHTVSAFGSAGYRFNFGPITAGPLFALRYTNVHIRGYFEQGAPGLDMIVQSQWADALIGGAGFAAATQVAPGVIPHLELALEKNLLRKDRTIETALVTVPDVGRTLRIGDDDGRVFGRLSGGVNFSMMRGLTGALTGETTIGRRGENEHAFFGTISGNL
jgi:outer membrane lipase/esterase